MKLEVHDFVAEMIRVLIVQINKCWNRMYTSENYAINVRHRSMREKIKLFEYLQAEFVATCNNCHRFFIQTVARVFFLINEASKCIYCITVLNVIGIKMKSQEFKDNFTKTGWILNF